MNLLKENKLLSSEEMIERGREHVMEDNMVMECSESKMIEREKERERENMVEEHMAMECSENKSRADETRDCERMEGTDVQLEMAVNNGGQMEEDGMEASQPKTPAIKRTIPQCNIQGLQVFTSPMEGSSGMPYQHLASPNSNLQPRNNEHNDNSRPYNNGLQIRRSPPRLARPFSNTNALSSTSPFIIPTPRRRATKRSFRQRQKLFSSPPSSFDEMCDEAKEDTQQTPTHAAFPPSSFTSPPSRLPSFSRPFPDHHGAPEPCTFHACALCPSHNLSHPALSPLNCPRTPRKAPIVLSLRPKASSKVRNIAAIIRRNRYAPPPPPLSPSPTNPIPKNLSFCSTASSTLGFSSSDESAFEKTKVYSNPTAHQGRTADTAAHEPWSEIRTPPLSNVYKLPVSTPKTKPTAAPKSYPSVPIQTNAANRMNNTNQLHNAAKTTITDSTTITNNARISSSTIEPKNPPNAKITTSSYLSPEKQPKSQTTLPECPPLLPSAHSTISTTKNPTYRRRETIPTTSSPIHLPFPVSPPFTTDTFSEEVAAATQAAAHFTSHSSASSFDFLSPGALSDSDFRTPPPTIITSNQQQQQQRYALAWNAADAFRPTFDCPQRPSSIFRNLLLPKLGNDGCRNCCGADGNTPSPASSGITGKNSG